MGSDEPRPPSLEVSFSRKRREARRARQAAEPPAEPTVTAPESPGATVGGPTAPTPAGIDSTGPGPTHGGRTDAEPTGDEPVVGAAAVARTAGQVDDASEAGESSAGEQRVRQTRRVRRAKAPAAETRESVVRTPKPPRKRRPWGVLPASVLTGLVVGLVMVGAGAGALDGCASLRGTASCGGAGLPILLVILAVGVALGSLLLRLLSRTASATSISFLAVAFAAVVSGLFLLDAIDGWPALVIVPALAVIGYLASHWVTTHYIDPAGSTETHSSSG